MGASTLSLVSGCPTFPNVIRCATEPGIGILVGKGAKDSALPVVVGKVVDEELGSGNRFAWNCAGDGTGVRIVCTSGVLARLAHSDVVLAREWGRTGAFGAVEIVVGAVGVICVATVGLLPRVPGM